MPEERKPMVIDDVHFVWVPYYEESYLGAHWLSINHIWAAVRVFEPAGEVGWRAVIYLPGVFPPGRSPEYYADRYEGTEKIAWEKAVAWVKEANKIFSRRRRK